MTASLDVEAATALKVKGNAAFSAHDWPTAIDFYTQAIEKNDRDASFFANRAQVSIVQMGHETIKLRTWVGKYQARSLWLRYCRCDEGFGNRPFLHQGNLPAQRLV